MSKRPDSIGLFWQDLAKVKAPAKEKIKRTPPEPFWLSPDYLPELEEARDFKPDLYDDMELWQASLNKERLLYDIEVYPNYCLFAFKSLTTGKVIYFEHDDDMCLPDLQKLNWVLHNFCIVNFNGRKYDFPITTLALAGFGPTHMWNATQMIIEQGLQAQDVYKAYQTKRLDKIDQIDLIELTALAPGLKVCAARLHAPRLQDLPFKPGTYLTADQILILRRYCINDLDNTGILYQDKIPQIELREKVGEQYKVDLRSHSDAQMAEAIISSEIRRIKGVKYLNRTKLEPGTRYKYDTPHFIKYQSDLMKWVLATVQGTTFAVDHIKGSVIMPAELENLVIHMGNSKYKIGIGGLHSQEKSVAHIADENYTIIDTDATSYYPKLILNAGLTPDNLGKDFILVYNGIVVKRIAAKEAGDIITAECLKIVANGTFGKLGSMWSIMYAPKLMIQVTVTGQLSILMLAERFELNGIEVTSINTDGIVVKCHRSRESLFKEIVKGWEKDTGFITEEVRYKATYSKDINNYIAVYETPQKGKIFKTKGAYGETAPKKNAINEICVEAIKELMAKGVSPGKTITECKDIRKFTSMRNVAGGAVKVLNTEFNPKATEAEMEEIVKRNGWVMWFDNWIHQPTHEAYDTGQSLVNAYEKCCAVTNGIYLGKLIRWYYATGEQGQIIYAKTGNKVPRTDGAKPCMNLPFEFPNDINYDWYIEECYKILEEIGHTVTTQTELHDGYTGSY